MKRKIKMKIKLNNQDVEISVEKLENDTIEVQNLLKYDSKFDNCYLYKLYDKECKEYIKVEEEKIVIQEGDNFLTISIDWVDENGFIDIEQCTKNDRQAPKLQKGKYKIRIDRELYTVEQSHLNGEQILALANKNSKQYELYQKYLDGKRELIEANQDVDFCKKGIERFETIPTEVQQG